MNEPNIRRNPKNTRKSEPTPITRGATPPRRPREVAEWDTVSNQLLRDAICAITGRGAAIMLSRTSDGGALSITVLDGEQRIKEYPRDSDEAEQTLRWLVDMYASE